MTRNGEMCFMSPTSIGTSTFEETLVHFHSPSTLSESSLPNKQLMEQNFVLKIQIHQKTSLILSLSLSLYIELAGSLSTVNFLAYSFKPFSHDRISFAPFSHEQSNIMSCATPSMQRGDTP